ncbi:MAG: MFS transporter [Alphaproteobacteria bacterium]|nr:MAG: MFS transporter [Alphaproteobacteria bacterium]
MGKVQVADEDRLTVRQRASYGVGIGGLWMVFMTTAFYLLYFYTDVLGLSGSEAGLILLIATLWDAVTDPAMGYLVSRTRSRWGQYRPYLIFGAFPMAVSFVAVFLRPDFVAGQIFLFALLTQIIFRTLFTVVYIPYTALISRLSRDANERASIASVKAFFVSAGALTASYFGLPLVAALGQGDDLQGFILTAGIFGGVATLTLMFTGFTVREKGAVGKTRAEAAGEALFEDTSSIKEALSGLFRNQAFLLVFFGVIMFTGCYTVLNKTSIYFFEYDYGDRGAVRYPLTAISVAGLVAPFLWAKVTHMTSKRFVWVSGCLLAAACLVTFYALGSQNLSLVWITAIYFMTGVGIQAFLMTFYAMTADAIDYGEWKTGQRVEAMGFGLLSFASKSSLALGGFALGFLLDEIGYVSKAVQSEDVLADIRLILVFFPTAGFLLSALIISFFPVSTQKHREIMKEIRNRK